MTQSWWAFGGGLLLIAALTAALAWRFGLSLGWLPLVALARACVQLAIIAALLRGILSMPWTVLLFALLMISTATWTAGGRLRRLWHGRRIALAGVVCGSITSLSVIFVPALTGVGLVNTDARTFVAVAGILIGNAMTAATLAGRNFDRSARAQAGVLEGWLALGATPAQAHDEVARHASTETLLPTLDQTKATGLVTLPGAFVGALFGGASPVQAAQFQLVVLAGIALTMVTTAITVTRLAARTPYVVGAGSED